MSFQPQISALLSERGLARAVGSPLVRGSLTIGAGIVTGNLLGFVRVALTAYLLGTHSRADALAVAISPVDTLNGVLINSMVFVFVPMLTERRGLERLALFRRLVPLFSALFGVLTLAILTFAPWLVRLLAPGLHPAYVQTSVNILRIVSLSSLAAGGAALHSALLYTDRRFAPSAFYQASLNLFTILCALALWNVAGVYGFAIGYTAGAWVQFAVVYSYARRPAERLPACGLSWAALLAKPAFFLVFAGALALNVIFTRAYATQTGHGMAAAFDYAMRVVGVTLAFLVSPISNALLPEIARLRAALRVREAFALIERTIVLAALAATVVCVAILLLREPAVALLFERGSFTAQSTQLVSLVLLGFGPSLVGWSLLEVTGRSLFALERPWLPALAALFPLGVNVAITLWLRPAQPHLLGAGASLGFLAGFGALMLLFRRRAA